jgi:hypothetical protein
MSRLRPRSLASWRRGDQAVPPECNYDVIHRSPAKLGSSIGDCHKVPCWRTGIAVNRDGHREVRGLDAIAIEDGAGCLAFLGGLVARGLAGRSLVISDAHPGLVDAVASTLVGSAWHRCRTHYMCNLLSRVPRSAQPIVATLPATATRDHRAGGRRAVARKVHVDVRPSDAGCRPSPSPRTGPHRPTSWR